MTEYLDAGENPIVDWPPEHLWPSEAHMEIRLGTSRDLYKETGFCAGILVVGQQTHVREEYKGKWFDRKSARYT